MHLYLHIPFCVKACHYCDFHFSTRLQGLDAVIDAMTKEIEESRDFLGSKILKTIYFGGGTPSLLSDKQLNAIMEAINKHYDISQIQEVSFEVNPENVGANNIKLWKSVGINRLSLGIQSFDSQTLTFMNRSHDGKQAQTALENCVHDFEDNVSVDIIYNRAAEDWDLEKQNSLLKRDFEILRNYNFKHLSAYSLTIEGQTAYAKWIKSGQLESHEDDYGLSQYEILMEETQKMGFQQYEVSNFAKMGCYAVHNTSYWQSKPYLGIGPSAHSFDGQNRYSNISSNTKYVNGIQRGNEIRNIEKLTESDKFNDAVLCGLRTIWGLDTKKIPQKAFLNEAFWGKVQEFIEKDWLEKNDEILTITAQGRIFNDHISSELFH